MKLALIIFGCMTNKILVIGMNPSKKPSTKAKENSTVKKLNDWMSKIGIQYFSFSNVHESVDHVPLSCVDYSRLNTITHGYDRVIALGNYASDALKKIHVKHFKMPHPSPRNRLLNDKEYEKHMLKDCRKYLK